MQSLIFDRTTWVVWANSQFATVLGVFLGLGLGNLVTLSKT